MSDILSAFQQQEAEATARVLQLNRWSLVLIELMSPSRKRSCYATCRWRR